MKARLAAIPPVLLLLVIGCGRSRRSTPQPARPVAAVRIALPRVAAIESAPDRPPAWRDYPENIDPKRVSSDATWGYLKGNPIKVGGPAGTTGPASQRLYLKHLRDSNFLALRARRVGSVGPGSDGHVVDLYELTGVDGRKYRLYLDMYHPETNPLDLVAPNGMFFHLRPGSRAPLSPKVALRARLPRAEKPLRDAEREYRLALSLWRELGGRSTRLSRQRKYLAYVLASQNYLLALINYAEELQAETSRRRAYARGAAGAIEEWLAAQVEKGHQAPPAAVLIWMYYHLGRAYAAADEVEKACRRGYDRVLALSPQKFPEGGARGWAWKMRLTGAYAKAQLLAENARTPDDWRRALAAAGDDLLTSPRTAGTTLRVRARIVRIKSLRALGRGKRALAEYGRGREDVARIRQHNPRAADSYSWKLISALGAENAPLEHTMRLASPEVMVATGLSLYRQKRLDAAAKVWRAVIIQGTGLPFAKRCSLGGEPRAWLYLGLAYFRLGKQVRAQEAWESALVEFWEKMPEKFRKDPKNARLVADLRDVVLYKCAHSGRLTAAARYNRTRQKADLERMRRFMKWEKRLKPGK